MLYSVVQACQRNLLLSVMLKQVQDDVSIMYLKNTIVSFFSKEWAVFYSLPKGRGNSIASPQSPLTKRGDMPVFYASGEVTALSSFAFALKFMSKSFALGEVDPNLYSVNTPFPSKV